MEEIWKNIPGYEYYYQASNLGNIRSVDRKVFRGRQTWCIKKGQVLIKALDKKGYHRVKLCRNSSPKFCTVHRLVLSAFKGVSDLAIDHIDSNKLNNSLANLEYVTFRENSTRHFLKTNKSSRYTGVFWHKVTKKWAAKIYKNKKTVHLGYFINEDKARDAYQLAKNN